MKKLHLIYSATLILAVVCYLPGIDSGFLFDDYASLVQLGDAGIINSWGKLSQYIFTGVTGPLGRPVALLSFAANAQTWPASPGPFIITNIVIHIANGILVYIFLTKLFNVAKIDKGNLVYLSLAASVFWLLHPFHVSAVLYIVQRMTTLSITFALLSLIHYVYFREALLKNAYKRCSLLVIAGFITAVLSIYTKEIGLLLPLQVLLVEILIGASRKDISDNKIRYLRFALVFPAAGLVLLAPLWFFAQDALAGWPTHGRGFTMVQRLLTEARVVGEYIISILVPRAQSSGVFHDGYIVSKSIFDPLGTLGWILIHFSLVGVAWWQRQKRPLITFAIFWFYANHLLESTIFMLELKFEHRNYLASLGWMLLIAYGILSINASSGIRNAIVVTWCVVLAALLQSGTRLWADAEKSALVWMEVNPNSARALDHAAMVLSSKPEMREMALSLLKRSVEIGGNDPVIELKYIWYTCPSYPAGGVNWQDSAQKLQYSRVNWSFQQVLINLLESAQQGQCPALDLAGVRSLIDAVRVNPNYSATRVPSLLAEEELAAALQFNEPETALSIYLNQKIEWVPLAVVAHQAMLLASVGYLEEAVLILEKSIAYHRQQKETRAFVVSESEEILQNIKNALIDP